MKIRKISLVLFGFTIAFAGCSQKPQRTGGPESTTLKPEAAHSEGAPASPQATAGLKFVPPSDWIVEKPTSTSHQAQYKLPHVQGDSEDAELIVYYFGGGGGTPQANVERWVGEFTGPDGKPSTNAKIEHKKVNGIPLTTVDVSGTYSSSMGMMQQGGQPQPGIRMLGAIAEAANGPWFIKLTGPERTVTRWKPTFDSFLNSIHPAD
jgi:hypothetical protein